VCWISGLECMSHNNLALKRLEPYRAGITTEQSIIFSCAVSVLPLLKAQVCHLV